MSKKEEVIAALKKAALPKPERPFVHLHTHSAYSLLEGAVPLAKLMTLAADDDQPALAITDRSNLFGALEFSSKAAKEGLQPIIGCTLEVDFDDEGRGSRSGSTQQAMVAFPTLVLLASDERGYQNLIRLVSLAYMEGAVESRPHISMGQLVEHNDGLIILTGGAHGPIDAMIVDDHPTEARARLARLNDAFGDRLYIELQRQAGYSPKREGEILAMAYELGIGIVATNEVFFAKREDYSAHDTLICIAEGRMVSEDDRRRLTPDHYLKSTAEMNVLFSDLPEAIDNTTIIAQRCAFAVQELDPILPFFTGGVGDDPLAAEAAELRKQAVDGLKDRLAVHPLADGYTREQYNERLEFELSVIENMKFPGYFLIVADFIKWAKEQGIPVGPGRGSGAGSLVAWSLTITDLDPLQFSLLFERFLNPERVSMPDFDIDFCQDRRDEVIRYVQDKYGRDQVAQIITFGTLQARAVLRDVGRVLQLPYGQVDRLCKMVPNNPANPTPLYRAVVEEAGLIEARKEEEVDHLIDISLKLEGLYRHASTHAAGIVIGDRPLDQLVPLYRDPRSDMPVTQFNMKWVEKAGLVKFDFLGLKTLTVIRTAQNYLKERNVEVDVDKLTLDDEATFKMLQRGETVGVFQLESMGMRKALIGMKADAFEDIIALVALYRPGPMENIPTYNARKHGEEEADYYHPKIEHVLKETQGVIIYQEQVMQIAQILSGYSLGEADMLRRAMGKKIASEMEAQRARFVDGCEKNDIKAQQANYIFDVLAKFADYGFNKSHAAAYALLSYQTAWLKANHPVEFLASLMTLDMGNTDKLNDFYREAVRAKIEVVAPSVNSSQVKFSVKDGKIHYALAAIKGVGAQAVAHIVEVRDRDGPFQSLTSFFSRVDPKQLNRKMLENLIHAGAFDGFGPAREELIGGLDRLIGHSVRVAENEAIGISDMFGGDTGETDVVLPKVAAWAAAERLQREHAAMGFYFSAHPLDEYQTTLEKLRAQSWADFQLAVKASGQAPGILGGTVSSIQYRKTKRGKRMGIGMLSDATGQFEVVLFDEQLEAASELLQAGRSLILNVVGEDRPEGVSLRVMMIRGIEDEAARTQYLLNIFLRDASPLPSIASQLGKQGEGIVKLVVIDFDGGREVEVELPGKRLVSPQIANALKAIDGVVHAELV
ncbi:DNA polymerase III subunit alpha [Ahrensia sp. R2A130]|uniref:DNA polymerase III subunit alpha n=1 Tax=Ahrensia sp. R2A130 TaxID=744979 RepID=UPI0001E0C314|nr:DNA polymerase III subunit alpha [Ahrensia sp. R2A130]EFL90229.1 DNA polymerase III subunit alpha [Ahrensia sp. R2A130]